MFKVNDAFSKCILWLKFFAAHTTAVLILYLIGKFSIAATYVIIYAYASELYPTEIRGMGLGFASYTGMLGAAIIPFVDYLVYSSGVLIIFAGKKK